MAFTLACDGKNLAVRILNASCWPFFFLLLSANEVGIQKYCCVLSVNLFSSMATSSDFLRLVNRSTVFLDLAAGTCRKGEISNCLITKA